MSVPRGARISNTMTVMMMAITPSLNASIRTVVIVDLEAFRFSFARVTRVADLVEEVKIGSSKWIKTKGREFRNFHWQKGYGAFSIGQSNVAALKRYIHNQKHHHQRVTFQDEYRKFLTAYGINFDERYVWD